MSSSDPLTRIKNLYHFTDRRSLPSIKRLGGLLSLAHLKAGGHVIAAPGGNDWSHEADERIGLDRYVHLCFCNQHPMEYAARQDLRINASVFLEIDSAVLKVSGVLFSSDVSNKAGVSPTTLDEACSIIDFDVLYTRTDWKDPEIQARLKQVRKYELLVPQRVLLNMVRSFPNG